MNKETIIVFADRRYHQFYKCLSIEGEKIGVYTCLFFLILTLAPRN